MDDLVLRYFEGYTPENKKTMKMTDLETFWKNERMFNSIILEIGFIVIITNKDRWGKGLEDSKN